MLTTLFSNINFNYRRSTIYVKNILLTENNALTNGQSMDNPGKKDNQ